MDKIRIIDVKQSILQHNEEDAEALRKELKAKGTYLLNVMSSPGSGKTTTLTRVINQLKDRYKIAVMEADIDSDVDARTIAEATGVSSIQLHTGGMCHLDAQMTRQGIEGFDAEEGSETPDLIILENIGNLVCPAEFDTGATRSIAILSVPEGHDKPLKYPLMFTVCDLVVINKIDVKDYFDFDTEKCKEYIAMRNPAAKVICISAKTGEGVSELSDWIANEIDSYKAE